jgi:magnesium transporter
MTNDLNISNTPGLSETGTHSTGIPTLVRNGDVGGIRDSVLHLHPYEAARRLVDLTDAVLWEVLARMPPHAAASVFAHLPIHRQVRLARAHDVQEVSDLLVRLSADDRVDVLQGLDNRRRRDILELLPEEERQEVEVLGRYPDDSVGSVMIPQFVSVSEVATVADAAEQIRLGVRGKEPLHTVYVTSDDGHLVGHFPVADLLTHEGTRPIGAILRRGTVTVQAQDPRVLAARKVQGFDLLEVAVVDLKGHLVGVVTVDDVIDVIEEETSDTVYQKAGVGDMMHQRDHVFSERLTQGSIAYPIRVRIGYLMVALVGGMAVGGLIEFWEDTLAAVIAAAIFIPVIMDMGGNTGTQSTTIFARGLALGHIDLRRFFPYFGREAAIGAVMGVALGTIGGTFAYFWQGAPNGVPQLGLAVGVSLAVVITVAAMLGFLLPYLMVKVGLDHAPGADPFITTIKDFTGLALYFFLVSRLIGGGDDGGEIAVQTGLRSAASAMGLV